MNHPMVGVGTIYGKIEDTTRYFSFLDLGYGGRIIFAFKDTQTFLDLYISIGLSFWD